MPVKRKALNVAVQGISEPPGNGLAYFNAGVPPYPVGYTGTESRRDGKKSADPKVLPEERHAAHTADYSGNKGRGVKRRRSYYRVDGVAYYLGRKERKDHGAHGKKTADEKTETPVMGGRGNHAGAAPFPWKIHYSAVPLRLKASSFHTS
jgi:hypothetical protein